MGYSGSTLALSQQPIENPTKANNVAKRAKVIEVQETGKELTAIGQGKVDRFAPDPKELIECTPEIAAYIVREISKGKSLIAICEEDGLPHHTTFLKQCQNNPELAEEYGKAKRLRAHARVEGVEKIVDSLDASRSSKDEAYITDVKAKNLVRLAEIGDPASFSPKMQMTHLHTGNTISITMDLTSAQSRPVTDITAAEVTETPQIASPQSGDEVEKVEGGGGSES